LRAVEVTGAHLGGRQQPQRAHSIERQSGAAERGDRLGVLRARFVERPARLGDEPLELKIDGKAPEVAVRRVDRGRALGLGAGGLRVAQREIQVREIRSRPGFGLREAREARVAHGTLEVGARSDEETACQSCVTEPLAG
jgi:hypothetical protein